MRLIIGGSADFAEPIDPALHASGFRPTSILYPDDDNALAVNIAALVISAGIPHTRFPLPRKHDDKRIVFHRNQAMADQADGLLVLRSDMSRAGRDLIERAKAKGLKTFIWPPFWEWM